MSLASISSLELLIQLQHAFFEDLRICRSCKYNHDEYRNSKLPPMNPRFVPITEAPKRLRDLSLALSDIIQDLQHCQKCQAPATAEQWDTPAGKAYRRALIGIYFPLYTEHEKNELLDTLDGPRLPLGSIPTLAETHLNESMRQVGVVRKRRKRNLIRDALRQHKPTA